MAVLNFSLPSLPPGHPAAMKTTLIFAACLMLTACATTQTPLTARTEASGAERPPEQLALAFEHADLNLRIEPASKTIRGDVTLTFQAQAPLRRVLLDLDNHFTIDAIAADGTLLPATAWSNPEGRLTIDLPRPLAAGEQVKVRVQYHGAPHVAKRAPWDGGFVWSTTPDGQPWVASAVQGEGCDLFWPCIDHPQGRAKLVDQHITVPAPLVAAGAGVAMGMDEKTAGAPGTGAPGIPAPTAFPSTWAPTNCCRRITAAVTATRFPCASGTCPPAKRRRRSC